jgi:hypothetical protein
MENTVAQTEWVCQRCRVKTTDRPREHVCKVEEPKVRKYLAMRRVDFEHYAAEALEISMASDSDQKRGIWGKVVSVRNLFRDGSEGEPWDIALRAIESESPEELQHIQNVPKCEHGLWVEAVCPDCYKCKHDVALSQRCVPCRRTGKERFVVSG